MHDITDYINFCVDCPILSQQQTLGHQWLKVSADPLKVGEKGTEVLKNRIKKAKEEYK